MTTSFPAPTFTSPRLQAAIIDLDGTMIDTADDFTAGLNGMLAQIDAAETSREEVVGYIGKGSENLIRSVLAQRFETDHAQDRFDEALAIYQAEYAKINGVHTRLYPEVEAGLSAMRGAGLKLACVTNKPHRFAVELLQQYGLSPVFQRRARRRQPAEKEAGSAADAHRRCTARRRTASHRRHRRFGKRCDGRPRGGHGNADACRTATTTAELYKK